MSNPNDFINLNPEAIKCAVNHDEIKTEVQTLEQNLKTLRDQFRWTKYKIIIF